MLFSFGPHSEPCSWKIEELVIRYFGTTATRYKAVIAVEER